MKVKLPSFPSWKAPVGEDRSPTTDELNNLVAAREAWAMARLVGWDKRGLQPADKDFTSWTQPPPSGVPVGVEHGHFGLRLGVCYEYAREGFKLRGLLLLVNPERRRAPWEFISMEFAGVSEDSARTILAEMFDALACLAEPLAENLSFAEVWRSKRKLVKQAIEVGMFWRDMRERHGIASHAKYSRGTPVELAWAEERRTSTASDTMARGGHKPTTGDLNPPTPARQIKDGKEVITVRLDFGNYRDEQLKESFGDLVKWLRRTNRGGGPPPPEPEPQKQGKKAVVLDKALNCLRAARVLDYCHGKPPNEAWDMLGLNRTYSSRNESNVYRDAKRFRHDFALFFPFEDGPVHNKTPKRNRH